MVRVAIAHDYLTQRGGAERVVLALARAFPDAPVYTTLYDADATYPEFRSIDVRTSQLNRVRFFRRSHRAALPLLPMASRSIRIDADVVVCSSSGWAHGFQTDGKKLVYCYAPARWLYEHERYLGDKARGPAGWVLKALSPALRRWDRAAAASADEYVAISGVTQERIRNTYGIRADVVPAPHTMNTSVISPGPAAAVGRVPEPGYHLVVSRLLPYKNVAAIVAAFALDTSRRLVVIGTGPQKQELMAMATDNVTFLEGLTDDEMATAYQGCVGLIAASHEDFGLTPLEAAAHGKPSAVLRWGGFLDTVVEGHTGVFFDAPTPEAILDGLTRLDATRWDEEVLVDRADQFSEAVFIERIRARVYDLVPSKPS